MYTEMAGYNKGCWKLHIDNTQISGKKSIAGQEEGGSGEENEDWKTMMILALPLALKIWQDDISRKHF